MEKMAIRGHMWKWEATWSSCAWGEYAAGVRRRKSRQKGSMKRESGAQMDEEIKGQRGSAVRQVESAGVLRERRRGWWLVDGILEQWGMWEK